MLFTSLPSFTVSQLLFHSIFMFFSMGKQPFTCQIDLCHTPRQWQGRRIGNEESPAQSSMRRMVWYRCLWWWRADASHVPFAHHPHALMACLPLCQPYPVPMSPPAPEQSNFISQIPVSSKECCTTSDFKAVKEETTTLNLRDSSPKWETVLAPVRSQYEGGLAWTPPLTVDRPVTKRCSICSAFK